MTGCVQTQVNGLNVDARVSALIDEFVKGWKVDVVRQIFDEEEAEMILSMSISPMSADDRLIWNLTKDGKFSIRSAYHLLQQARRRKEGETLEGSRGDLIWKLGVPGAVKHFLWKLANNILPTKQNLYQRRIVKDAVCPICLNEEESVMHYIWWCPVATDVWAEGGSPVQKWRVGMESFPQLWEEVYSKLTDENVEKMAMIMRNIWHRRNKVVFENKFADPASVVLMSLLGYEDFKLALGRRGGEVSQAAASGGISRGLGCEKLEGLKLKVNFDAVIKVSLKKMGIGVIIRDCRGEVHTGACVTRELNYGVYGAKCTAMWEVMVLCEELGLGDVIFEWDVKGVIDAMNNGEKDESSYGHLVESLQKKLKCYSRWETGFIHREGNEVAHQLAKLAVNGDVDRYWVEEGPEAIKNQLCIDKMYTVSVTS